MPDDKFIFMGLHDDTKNIAEILRSDTAKKILDFLADTKEASEKDIADNLNMPINTIEYNLKKLLKTGFVKPSKNFFWSVKGKKIPTYKLSKKHIIISPDKKPNLTALKTILPIFLIAAIALILVALYNTPPSTQQTTLKQFQSYNELLNFLEQNQENVQNFGEVFAGVITEDARTFATTGTAQDEKSSDYSITNIQVQGIDEADIVKNDGKYIYLISNNKVFIINAYPAENMEILSEINSTDYVNNIFINDNKLILFLYKYSPVFREDVKCLGKCPSPSTPSTIVQIYNTEDKSNPELENTFEIQGSYIDSRMINNYIYLITNKYIYSSTPELPAYSLNYKETEVRASEIYYFDYLDNDYGFTTISSINIDNGDSELQTYLTGGTNNIYVSKNDIYLTYPKITAPKDYVQEYAEQVALKLLPKEEINEIINSDKKLHEKLNEITKIVTDHSFQLTGKEKAEFDEKLLELTEQFQLEMSKQTEKTIIHKIQINNGEINYQTNGEVPGRVLNQFSMDEYQGNFRIVTTTGDTWQDTSLNHVYVLNKDLKITSSIQDIAQGERVYSTRFLGDRLYLVTFKQVDPFFVIDLSNPEDLKILGYLKIPGYSSYLHPYDENHIIGIGQEDRNLKISLFDISDFENPEEKAKYSVEADYSHSDALYDHKAFLFDKNRGILVIPVSYTLSESYTSEQEKKWQYWQGAFVFNINADEITLRGEITHELSEQGWNDYVRRSLYMDNTLYTISTTLVKANNLNTLELINKLELPNQALVYEREILAPEEAVN